MPHLRTENVPVGKNPPRYSVVPARWAHGWIHGEDATARHGDEVRAGDDNLEARRRAASGRLGGGRVWDLEDRSETRECVHHVQKNPMKPHKTHTHLVGAQEAPLAAFAEDVCAARVFAMVPPEETDDGQSLVKHHPFSHKHPTALKP